MGFSQNATNPFGLETGKGVGASPVPKPVPVKTTPNKTIEGLKKGVSNITEKITNINKPAYQEAIKTDIKNAPQKVWNDVAVPFATGAVSYGRSILKSVATGMRMVGFNEDKAISTINDINEIDALYKRSAVRSPVGEVSYLAGNTVANVSASLGLGSILKGLGAGEKLMQYGVGYTLQYVESSDEYNEAIKAGKTYQEALLIAATNFLGTGFLESAGNKYLFDSIGKGTKKALLRVSIEEGLTEGAQTIYQNAVARIGYDKTRHLLEGVGESILGGAMGGAFAGAVIGTKGFNQPLPNIVNQLSKSLGVTKEEASAIALDLNKRVENKVAQDIAPKVQEAVNGVKPQESGTILDRIIEANVQTQPKAQPEVVREQTEFIHYSNQENLTELSPDFQGTGQPGTEKYDRRAYPELYTPIIYAYKKGEAKVEARFENKPMYEGVVEGKLVKPGTPEAQMVAEEADRRLGENRMVYPETDRTARKMMILKVAKEQGFAGYDMGEQGIILFEPQKVKRVGAEAPTAQLTIDPFEQKTGTVLDKMIERKANPVPQASKLSRMALWTKKQLLSMRQLMGTLGKYGQQINEKVRLAAQYRSLSNTLDKNKLDSVFKLNTEELASFVDVLAGKTVAISELQQRAVDEWKLLSREILNRSRKAGLDVGDLGEDYFPQVLNNEWKQLLLEENAAKFEDAILDRGIPPYQAKQIMGFLMKGKTKMKLEYGNLELPREIIMPEFMLDRDPQKVLNNYIDSSNKRIWEATFFGKNDEVIEALISQIKEDKGSAMAFIAEEIWQEVRTINRRGSIEQFLSNILSFNLKHSAIRNLAEPVFLFVNNPIDVVLKNMIKAATTKGITEAQRLSDVAQREGFIRKVFAGDTQFQATLLKAVGFEATQSWANRVKVLSALDTLTYLQKSLIKNPSNLYVRKQLERMGVNPDGLLNEGITETDRINFANNSIYDLLPQGKYDMPIWADRGFVARGFWKFKSFSVKMSEYIYNEIKFQASNGDYKGLVRFIIMALIFGEIGKDLYDFIKYILGVKKDPTRPMPKNVYELGVRLTENVMFSVGVGVMVDFTQMISYGVYQGFVPTILGAQFSLLESIYQGAKRLLAFDLRQGFNKKNIGILTDAAFAELRLATKLFDPTGLTTRYIDSLRKNRKKSTPIVMPKKKKSAFGGGGFGGGGFQKGGF